MIAAEAKRAKKSSLVNVTQIAELAEVGVSAVSNWRRRFADFPRPVEGVPGGRDLFELRQVERWLRGHGRLKREDRGKQLLFEAADGLRSELSDASMTEALGAALALVALSRRGSNSVARGGDAHAAITGFTARDPALGDVFQPLLKIDRGRVSQVLAAVAEIEEGELVDCFDWVLAQHSRQHGRRGEQGSGPIQTSLLEAVIDDGEKKVVYDPAAGWGGFLRAVWRRAPSTRKPQLFAQEVNPVASRIARQRFLVEEIPLALDEGNTLLEDGWPELRADVVVCSPPFGMRQSWPAATAADPRWTCGKPPAIADFAWLQHCVHHLNEKGRAYVFLPAGSLFRGGREGDIRRRLLQKGAVEAIVSLPPGSALGTSLPLVLWVLRRASGDPSDVLLVDLPAGRKGASIDRSIARVASLWPAWRAGGNVPGDCDIAASVPVAELMGAAANLVPARWINQDLTGAQREEEERQFEELALRTQKTRRALQADVDLPPPSAFPSVEWVSVERLAEEGKIDFVKGVQIRPEDCADSGIPVLRTRDLPAGGREELEPTTFLAGRETSASALTKPGDIIVSPASGSLRASVDRKGGHLLARPLQALRLAGDFMDPEVVAVFLESSRNRRFVTGSVYARVSLRDLELPVLEPGAAEALRAALVQLNEQEKLAAALAASAQELRRKAVSLTAPIAAPFASRQPSFFA